MYIISRWTGIVKNYFLLFYSRHKKPSTLAGLKSTFVFLIQRGITHTLLLCELILLACVKDLLYRLLSPIFIRRSGFSLFYSLLGKATALQKISHLIATCRDASFFVVILFAWLPIAGCRGETLHFWWLV